MKSGKILKRIPRGLLSQANDKFRVCLSRVNENPDNVEAWFELLSFTHCCLLVPGDRGGKKHAASLATKVSHQLSSIGSFSVDYFVPYFAACFENAFPYQAEI